MAHTRRTPDAREQVAAKHLIESRGVRAAARTLGVHHSTVKRIASGSVVDEHALVALRANAKLKTADDFKAGSVSISLPRKKPSVSWPLDAIRGARDAQLNGDFAKAAPLGTAMRLDDAIFVAHHNRTAPIGSLNLAVDSAGTTRGDSIAKKAKDLVTAPRSVLLSLASTLVLHGVAFGQVTRETLDDGEEVAMSVKEWPIEFVKWNETKGLYETKVDGGEVVDIVHGDGEWIIFAKQDTLPHQHEACVLPGSLIFAAHLDSIKSWNAASSSHGQAKLIGELPEGVPLQEGDEGTLSAEAAAFLSMLTDVISGESGAGIRPAGSKTDFVANGSSAWQVFSELAMNREKAAARVWLGNDGVLGSVGGAPGVDIATLFGVATTKVQGDVDAIEKGLYEGLYVPWTAVNFGDARLAPRLKFEIPDADAAQKNEQKKAARLAFFEAIELLKKNSMVIDQPVIDAIAEEYGVDAPLLQEAAEAVVPVDLAPTDVATVIFVREARSAKGFPPMGDFRDDMTLAEYKEYLAEQKEIRQAKAQADAEAKSQIEVADATQENANVGSDQTTSNPGGVVDPAVNPQEQQPVE
jgi:hypothetical protein